MSTPLHEKTAKVNDNVEATHEPSHLPADIDEPKGNTLRRSSHGKREDDPSKSFHINVSTGVERP